MVKSRYVNWALMLFGAVILAKDLVYIITNYMSVQSFSPTVAIGISALILKIFFTIFVYIYFCKKIYVSGLVIYNAMEKPQVSRFRTLFNMVTLLGILPIGNVEGVSGFFPILAVLIIEGIIYLVALLIFNFFANIIIKKAVGKA